MPDDAGVTSLHVRRAKRGDGSSLEWLIERFTPLLLAQARYRLSPALAAHVDPEDLVQEVWTVALSGLPALGMRDGRETPVLLRFLSTTLLYRVANLTRKHIRGVSRTKDESLAPLVERLPEETRGAVTRIAGREARGDLARAIGELSERDRAIVVLRGIERHSNARVAELVGDSPNAVSLRYNRALAALRERLVGPARELVDAIGADDDTFPENA
jgi:RNA polymerase sigma factor (sigma-70 family)